MNHRAVTLAALLLAACAPRSSELNDQTRAATVKEIRQAVDDLFDAMNAHDAERVLRRYQESDDFAYVGVNDVEVGWETFQQRTRQWYQQHPEDTFEHTLLHVHVLSPTVAVAIVRGSSSDAPQLAWTEVFVRDGRRWKIAHEHEAWPGATPIGTAPHPGTEGM